MRAVRAFLLLALIIFSGCATYHADDDRSKYQADLTSLKGSASKSIHDKHKLQNPDQVVSKSNAEHEFFKSTRGIGHAEFSCTDYEKYAVKHFIGGLLSSPLGIPNRQACTKKNQLYWVRIEWTCSDEFNAFYRPKTASVLKKGLSFSFGNKDLKTLEQFQTISADNKS